MKEVYLDIVDRLTMTSIPNPQTPDSFSIELHVNLPPRVVAWRKHRKRKGSVLLINDA